jgi:type IV pilus assembly protein PilO
MKKNQVMIMTAIGLIVAIAAWWFLLYSPRNAALAKAQKQLQDEKQTEQTLKTTLAHRQDLKKNEPKLDLRMAQMATWLPDQPNLAQFINDATAVAKQSGIDFVSIAPAVPAAGAAGEGVISLSIQIKGGFFQLLDYLVRVEQMPRSVVVDNLSLAPSVKDGEVELATSISARMFTSSVPQFTTLPPGAASPAAPGSTSTAGAPSAPGSTTSATPVPAGATAAPARP